MSVHQPRHLRLLLQRHAHGWVHQAHVARRPPVVIAERGAAPKRERQDIEELVRAGNDPLGKVKAELLIAGQTRRLGPETELLRVVNVDVRTGEQPRVQPRGREQSVRLHARHAGEAEERQHGVRNPHRDQA